MARNPEKVLTFDTADADGQLGGIANRAVDVARWTVDRNEQLVFTDGTLIRATLCDSTGTEIPGDSSIILAVMHPNEKLSSELRHISYQKYVDISFGLQDTLDYRDSFAVEIGDGGRVFDPDSKVVIAVESSVAVDLTKSKIEIKMHRVAL